MRLQLNRSLILLALLHRLPRLVLLLVRLDRPRLLVLQPLHRLLLHDLNLQLLLRPRLQLHDLNLQLLLLLQPLHRLLLHVLNLIRLQLLDRPPTHPQKPCVTSCARFKSGKQGRSQQRKQPGRKAGS